MRNRGKQPESTCPPHAWAIAVLAAASILFSAPAAHAERTRLKPGWNLFSPAQDIEMGRAVAQDAERQLAMLGDPKVDDYLNRLGRKLAAKAPGEKYPYQLKAVNDKAINAFALPGGFLYVNRGVIEAADSEAQLAGVLAHEIAHVALRHGTNQASKAYAAQVPLAILGGALGSASVGAVLTQIGAGFALNSVLLKYSRNAESQADILGTQILYDCGYDPRAMAQFFEKIQAESKGGRLPQFFSSHPNPENRMERVNEEIGKLGGVPRGYRTTSDEFGLVKRRVTMLPAPPKAGSSPTRGPSTPAAKPSLPSARYERFENSMLRIHHPDNWRSHGEADSVTLAPEGGVVQDTHGNTALAYGMIINRFDSRSGSSASLEDATSQLIEALRQSNPTMRVEGRQERLLVDGQRALSTFLSNDSPVGGREKIWLVTLTRSDGLLHFVCVAPESEFNDYDRTFRTMIDSVRLLRR